MLKMVMFTLVDVGRAIQALVYISMFTVTGGCWPFSRGSALLQYSYIHFDGCSTYYG